MGIPRRNPPSLSVFTHGKVAGKHRSKYIYTVNIFRPVKFCLKQVIFSVEGKERPRALLFSHPFSGPRARFPGTRTLGGSRSVRLLRKPPPLETTVHPAGHRTTRSPRLRHAAPSSGPEISRRICLTRHHGPPCPGRIRDIGAGATRMFRRHSGIDLRFGHDTTYT